MRARAVWLLRVLWFLLPLTLGRALGDALASTPGAVPRAATIGLWGFWTAGVVATAVPLPATLTAIRSLTPGAAVLAMWTIVDTDAAAVALVGALHAAVAVVVAMNQLIGDRFADGASYGDERRMLLRPPTQLALFALPLTWMVGAASLVSGPLLLAGEQWIAGAALTMAGLPVAALAARAMHQLGRRWIVFVPTGMVLHDHTTLTEPVLFRRTSIERLGPAIAGSPARDLSNRAAGLLIECQLTDPAPLGLRSAERPGSTGATLTDVRRFLFSPTRPGELLDEAERRGIAVG